jgi:chromosomal replication initiation ATPase DnaA
VKAPAQLVLDLPLRSARGRDDFLVTESNGAAVALIERYPDWPHHAVALVGEAGSGKTHLLEVWRSLADAAVVEAGSLAERDLGDLLTRGALAVDGVPGEHLPERALFHLLNWTRESRGHLLLASRLPPADWMVALPDLASRLRAVPAVTIGRPDDSLLRGVLVKQFADRQLKVEEAVLSYLLRRMPRSLAAVQSLVAELDRRALQQQAGVTRPLAAAVLREMTSPGLFDGES